MRAAFLLIATLVGTTALAWGPQGINDAGCLVWDYNEVVDAGLTSLPDGGFVGPAGLCIQLVEKTSRYLRGRVVEQFDAAVLPDPPGVWIPVGIPSQDGGVRPLNPFDPPALTIPTGACLNGQGYSFENGTWQGWTPSGSLNSARVGPVYGNNVHIERLRPPGYVMQATGVGMNQTVGGDYWWFSRDVNQQGDYWVGTRDIRRDWTVFPGQTQAEANTGMLVSPTFVITANFIDFWLGGGVHVSQRVELEILPQASWTQAALLAQADGIGISEFPTDYASFSKLDGSYVVVRASSPLVQSNGENDFMGRHVGWNVAAFKNLSARLRVVDAARPLNPDGTQSFAHLNVDHFRCTNTVDPKTVWRTRQDTHTVSAVGEVVLPQPLWGTTDTHTHAAANVSFGGHLIWGDVSDSLATVYNCESSLQPITLVDGTVVRNPVAQPDIKTECSANFGVVLLASLAANAACVALSAGLAAVPFIGPVLAAGEIAVCTTAVAAATIGLMSSPVLTNYTLHGGASPISGGLDLGDFLEAIAKLITGKPMHIQGVIETLDWDLPDGRHSGRFGRLHQQYQFQMVTRAWQGGLRLVVLDSINGRAMQGLLDQKVDYNDWDAIRDTVIAARRLTACAGDPVFKPGPLCNIAEVAKTPMHARRIIGTNKVAIILGTEVDELGKPRLAATMTKFGHPGVSDTLQLQLQDLYDWGIRKITAIHGIDNPLGGTGIFNDIYATSQQFHNLTTFPETATSASWDDWKPGSDYALPASLVDPLAGLVIGTFTPGVRLQSAPGVTNNSLVQVDETTPLETTIGGYSDITYRYGFGSGAHPLTRFRGDFEVNGVPHNTFEWIPMKVFSQETGFDSGTRHTFKSLYRLNNLGWILGAGPGGLGSTSRCSLDNAHLPMDLDDGQVAIASDNYGKAPGGHFNAQGLSSGGRTFIKELMKKGMTFDLDHFSQKGRLDAYDAAHTFAQEAGQSTDYATFGVHTNFRGVERSGPVPLEFRDEFGTGNETERTANELLLERRQGGVVSPSLTATVAPKANFGSANNNCDFSSKAWAQKYLAFMKQLKGHGIAVSTDMNGLTTPMASRYGFGACHTNNTWEDDWQTDGAAVQNWPRDFSTAAQGCQFNTKLPGNQWNPNCPSTQMVQAQHQEASAVIYDDYAGRVTQTLNASPLIQRVLARGAAEVRDDNGPRPLRDEFVTIGASKQQAPIKKFKNSVASNNTGWDYNVDGLKHVGLYPDFFQDVRNGGLTFEQLTPLFNAAEEYVRMWEQNCALGVTWTTAHGEKPPVCTGTGEGWPAL
jgi:hypothetical protein